MHDDTTSTIQSDMVFLIIAIFAIVIAIMPAFGFINIPEIRQENGSQTSTGTDNVLEVRYDYDEDKLYVMGMLLEDGEALATKLGEYSTGYSQIRFLASKTTPWNKILPLLRDLKIANLPIKCVHIIGKEITEK
ncbi:MAG: hypothetical protein E3K37_02420 [Candidatus Kuenenia sp.]|nr:hypothetical protein [Candidatus Kuenenia hertensis]